MLPTRKLDRVELAIRRLNRQECPSITVHPYRERRSEVVKRQRAAYRKFAEMSQSQGQDCRIV